MPRHSQAVALLGSLPVGTEARRVEKPVGLLVVGGNEAQGEGHLIEPTGDRLSHEHIAVHGVHRPVGHGNPSGIKPGGLLPPAGEADPLICT